MVYHSVVTVAPRGAVTFSGRHLLRPIDSGPQASSLPRLRHVDWFNHRRLLEPIGNIPPAEAEARYYAQLEERAVAA